MKKDDLYVAEYSYRQGAFHIETLEEAVSTNKRIIYNSNGDWNDYVIFAYGTQEECYKEMKQLMVYVNELEEHQGYIDCQEELDDE